MKPIRLAACFVCLPLLLSSVRAAPEAFEIGPHNKDQLPGGKEADGIIGDFVLRNNLVEVVISANLPHRKANMSTFSAAIVPGCLFDLTLRGANNDQITIFAPGGQQGPVSLVRIVSEGRDGEAVIETIVTAANNNGLFKRHEYRLKDDWQGVLVVTTYRNESSENKTGSVDDRWTNFLTNGTIRAIAWADAVDPADKAGYAYAWIERDGMSKPPQVLDLKPGQELKFARFLAVGRSPAEAFGIVSAMREKTGAVSGSIKDEKGQPLPQANVTITIDGKRILAYPDENGRFTLRLPPGKYETETIELGRPAIKQTLEISEQQAASLDVKLAAPSSITFDIRDESGRGVPCKAQFIGIDGTASPYLGPHNRARGCRDQYHSEKGQFRVQVAPGKYKVVVTHGIEFSHLEQTVDLGAGKTEAVKGTLRRLLKTPGWVSADFHNHSTPSGDNTCGTDDRIINLAAEHIEFAPTTEHNRFYDWKPHIDKLGLTDEISTVPGVELTGSGAHFNSFPFEPKPRTQDWGAPQWQKDPRLNAVVLRDYQGPEPLRWLQINHPDMVENFIDRDGDGRVDGGYLGLGQLIDGVETQNGMRADILAGMPFYIARDQAGKEIVIFSREFIWLQMLNRGARYWGMAVSDAHSIHGNGVGGWRMYMPSSTDEPRKIDWREISRNSKAGRMILTSGPYLEVAAEDGTPAGREMRGAGGVRLKVKVQCTDWIDIDRVQVLVNGRARSDLNFTRKSHAEWFGSSVTKFDRTISVPLSEDSHVIVVAYGENFDLSTGYGTSAQAKLKPCAYNNPIFVDVDGGGFKPNGDTLDWPLPVKGLTLEDAKRILSERSK
jgi:carboxypeptidase family protein